MVDATGARVQVFDLKGNFIEDWRDEIIPWGIASYQGYIFVAGEKMADGVSVLASLFQTVLMVGS